MWLYVHMNKHTRFQNYLSRKGDVAAAAQLHIHARAAKAYRLGERAPKVKQIPSLVKFSEGEICYSCFFEAENE